MELLVKAQVHANAIAEVPFAFGLRTAGESKLDSKVMRLYLAQLLELYWYSYNGLIAFAFIVFLVFVFVLWRYLATTPEPMVTTTVQGGHHGQ